MIERVCDRAAGREVEALALEQADILLVLTKYLSPPHANAVFRQAVREAAAPLYSLSSPDREHVLTNMQRGLGMHLRGEVRESAVAELRRAFGLEGPGAISARTFEVRLESDISLVRTEARRIAEAVGASGFAVQKATTIVSELSRNMVFYAGGGEVTLTPPIAPSRTLTILARDQGPGIPDVSHVMSGNYRSKTGLGRGLLGCKRLADKFRLETGASGTQVEVEVKL